MPNDTAEAAAPEAQEQQAPAEEPVPAAEAGAEAAEEAAPAGGAAASAGEPAEAAAAHQATEGAPADASAEPNSNNKRQREDEEGDCPEEGPEKKRASSNTLGADPLGADPLAAGAADPAGGPSYAEAVAPVYGLPADAAANQPSATDPPPAIDGPAPVAFSTAGGPAVVLDVPANQVGKLIGRAGETIRQLQLSSDTRIQVDHATGGDTKRVTVTGATHEQVERARQDILALLSSEGPSGGGGPPGGAAGDGSETMECPAQVVGRIIGRGGETIRALQSASEAHITVDQNFPEGVPRKVLIQGRPEACRRAAMMITALIQGEPGSAQAIIQRVCQEAGIGTTHQVTCPKGLIGRIIGRQGETIKQIQRQTGATIQIDQGYDPCHITIAGQATSADGAKRIIEDIINGGEPFGRPGPGGPGGFPGYGPPGGAFPGTPYGAFPGGPYGGAPPYGYAAPYGAPGGFPGYGAPGYGGYGADAYGVQAGGYGGGYGGGPGGGGAPGGAAPGGGGQWQELHDDQSRPYYYSEPR